MDELPIGQHQHVTAVENHAQVRASTRGPAQRHLIVSVEGGHGYGKTSLLGAVKENMRGRTPHASFAMNDDDLPDGEAGVLALILRIAGALGRHIPGHRDLRFRRLIVATLAMNSDMSGPPDARRIRRQFRRTLAEYRGLKDKVGALGQFGAAILAQRVPSVTPDTVTAALTELVDSTASLSWRLTFGDALTWFADPDGRDPGGAGADKRAIDTLTELSGWARNPSPGTAVRISLLLIKALLADIDEGCRPHGRVRQRKCLVLLDDASSEMGLRVLSRICEAIGEHAGQDPAASLTIVATGPPGLRSVLAGRLPGAAAGAPLTIGLAPLTVDEALVAAHRNGRYGDDGALIARTVHGLTHGQPSATIALTAAVAGQDWPYDLDAALTETEDELLGGLLGGPAPLDDLTTAAAARSQPEARLLFPDGAPAFDGMDLWPPELTGTSLPRTLLLRRLARRPPAHPQCWQRVHELLARETGGDLYYLVGAGLLGLAAEHLTERLTPTADLALWLGELAAAARAPRRLDPRPPDVAAAVLARELCDPCAGPAEGVASRWRAAFPVKHPVPPSKRFHDVLNLLAHCAVAADPFMGVRRNVLYDRLSHAVDDIGRAFGARGEGLAVASDWFSDYQRIADAWRPLESRPQLTASGDRQR